MAHPPYAPAAALKFLIDGQKVWQPFLRHGVLLPAFCFAWVRVHYARGVYVPDDCVPAAQSVNIVRQHILPTRCHAGPIFRPH